MNTNVRISCTFRKALVKHEWPQLKTNSDIKKGKNPYFHYKFKNCLFLVGQQNVWKHILQIWPQICMDTFSFLRKVEQGNVGYHLSYWWSLSIWKSEMQYLGRISSLFTQQLHTSSQQDIKACHLSVTFRESKETDWMARRHIG